jgi:protein-L-isoaspartate(D-aspartate) O-methyltransferase
MQDKLKAIREAYAARILRRAGVDDPRIEAAFAAVPREAFAGPPPWTVLTNNGIGDRTSDPAPLYDDVLVAIDAGRNINNGQPSLHASSIAALAPTPGATIVQIGAGAGYYTAILAELVGPSGKVIAYEIETDIAARATTDLARWLQVELIARSGVGETLSAADAIYVNAAADHPVRQWLDALKPGGRLVFPLHGRGSHGAMLLVTRPLRGDLTSGAMWPARFLSGAVFIGCAGAQSREMSARLDEAFRRGGARATRSLKLGAPPAASDWVRGEGWALSTEAAG